MPMIHRCGSCCKKVLDSEEAIQCDISSCKRWWHRTCAFLSLEEYEDLGDEDAQWYCPKCEADRIPKLKQDDLLKNLCITLNNLNTRLFRVEEYVRVIPDIAHDVKLTKNLLQQITSMSFQVSPILIKRKTEVRREQEIHQSSRAPSPTSSRNNVASDSCVTVFTPRRSLRKHKPSYIDDETENDIWVTNKKPSTSKKNNNNAVTPVKVSTNKRTKEKRKMDPLEECFKDGIRDVNMDENSQGVLIRDISINTRMISCTPLRETEFQEMDHELFQNPSSSMRSPSQKVQQVITDSDNEANEIPSPPKRRSLRTPKAKELSLVPVQKSSRKSSQKALCAILSKDSEMDLSSPEQKKTPRRSKALSAISTKEPEMSISSPEEKKTPRRSKKNNDAVPESPSLIRQVLTPKPSARKRLDMTSPVSTKKVNPKSLTPLRQESAKRSLMGTPSTPIQEARFSLHTATVPDSLPCREKEFENIFNFLSRKIEDRAGGSMYISGVPGTGKTATVTAVVRALLKESKYKRLPEFEYIELNALRLTEPRQAYVRIWMELTGQKLSGDLAMEALENRFKRFNKRPCLVLIDELDYLCNRRQDVIYNLLEWTTKPAASLIVIAIANTMDLPERTLKGKVASRIGLTRLVFQPYTFQQLQSIVMDRIRDNPCFHADAVQFVARKVAAVSGDARRALDICRRATEIVSESTDVIKVAHIDQAMGQIFSGLRVQAIKKTSLMGQLILRVMLDQYRRTGVEETTAEEICRDLVSLCASEGLETPSPGIVQSICTSLTDSGLIIAEPARFDFRRKLSLNVSEDDIHYALNC